MPEVEILWPDAVDPAPLSEAAAPLEEAGVETAWLLQPVRRGPVLEVLVLVATPALQPFLKVLFEKVAADAYTAARRFVTALLRRPAEERPAPTAVVFESTATGAQFVFTSGLPERAYRAALEEAPGQGAGRFVWDGASGAWLQFEPGSA